MMDRYGKAVVEERTAPVRLADLERYVRLEHGPGTETAYILAQAASASPKRQILARIVRSISNAYKAGVRLLSHADHKEVKMGIQCKRSVTEDCVHPVQG